MQTYIVQCSWCKADKKVNSSHYTNSIKNGMNCFCNKKCRKLYKNTYSRKEFICKFCNQTIYRIKDSRNKNIFCNQSCAASYNNLITPKRKKEYNHICTNCKIVRVCKKNQHCDKCKQKLITERENRVIGTLRYKHGLRCNINTLIRMLGATIVKNWPKICKHCGYNKHVQICHIKPVASFPDDATIKEVNHPDNLILLCPNCHWEFDHPPKPKK